MLHKSRAIEQKKLGFIINPVAGLGGRVGLKGSDGEWVQEKALELGAIPIAQTRAMQTLQELIPLKEYLTVITFPGEMGEHALREYGFNLIVIGSINRTRTTADDTIRAARKMKDLGVLLLLFAGGDGTARDILDAVDRELPVLGIPAGVKIHSAVYAINPRNAGVIARKFLQARQTYFKEAEVMDIDEEAVREGRLSAILYGYLNIPFDMNLVQDIKSPSPANDRIAAEGISQAVIENMKKGHLYILGPGSTTQAIASTLGLPKTLTGVDVILDGKIIARDVNEQQLLDLIKCKQAEIIVSPIGGQGYIFGRGNQQISPTVINKISKNRIIVVATPWKIASLRGRPLLVDTGNEMVDTLLCGYIRVITGHRDQTIYKISI